MSPFGPSRQILRWNLMSAFGELRTSRQADTKRIGSERPECMVRPCGARRFRRAGGERSCINVSGLSLERAPGHHGYQRACELITGKASTGPFGSPVFAYAGKTEPPSLLILSQTSAGNSTSYKCTTASGKPYHRDKLTAASRTLPFGTRLRVTDLKTNKSVEVTVMDRGPAGASFSTCR